MTPSSLDTIADLVQFVALMPLSAVSDQLSAAWQCTITVVRDGERVHIDAQGKTPSQAIAAAVIEVLAQKD